MAKIPDTIDFDIRVHGIPAGYKLVPIDPPAALAPLLTAYSLEERHGWSERDHAEIMQSLRRRWAAILAALPDSLPPVTLGVAAVDVPGERFLMAERLVEALADATTYPEQDSARAALMKHLREWANAGVKVPAPSGFILSPPDDGVPAFVSGIAAGVPACPPMDSYIVAQQGPQPGIAALTPEVAVEDEYGWCLLCRRGNDKRRVPHLFSCTAGVQEVPRG